MQHSLYTIILLRNTADFDNGLLNTSYSILYTVYKDELRPS